MKDEHRALNYLLLPPILPSEGQSGFVVSSNCDSPLTSLWRACAVGPLQGWIGSNGWAKR